MNHEKWIELADIYSAGALDGNELADFENHLAAGCELCQAHLIQTDSLLENLAGSYALVSPPPALKNQILNQLEQPALAVPRVKAGVSWAFLGITAWAFASLLVILTWNLSKTRKEMHELGVLMTMPAAKIMEMKGMDSSEKAAGRVIQEPGGRRCFFLAMGLAPAPKGKVYELWALEGGTKPVPMGTFRVDDHGCAMLNLSLFQGMDRFEKFAVTLEPSGGVPKPTGPMHLTML